MTSARLRTLGLSVTGLCKRYGPNLALADASFSVAPGETVAVLGENGAGKSTLVKILAGVVQPSSGRIDIDGARAEFESPRAALRAGVVLIPQELAYVPALSVAENIMVGRSRSLPLVNQARFAREAREWADAVGLDIDLGTPMSQLSLAQRQLVEIAKALARQARVLLLDEPTAALANTEASRLFTVLARLRERGVMQIYISHRLDEVITHSNRIVVLRDGRLVAGYESSACTRSELIAAMLGSRERDKREARAEVRTSRPAAGTVDRAPQVLSVEGLRHRTKGLDGVSLSVDRGEIVALFGVRGAGQETFARTLAGLRPHDDGTMVVNGVTVGALRSVRQAARIGVAYVPPDRKSQGLVLDHGISRNLAFPQLKRLARWGLMSRQTEQRLVREAIDRLQIKCQSPNQLVRELSGGNQQKVLLASRIYGDPRALVIEEPSRGVDVGARAQIHELLQQVARNGTAIVLCTSDVEEAVALSDRICVFRVGRIAAELTGEDKTAANVLDAAGQNLEES